MNRAVPTLAAALAAAFAPRPAAACSCAEVTVERSWHQYPEMFLATVRGERRDGALQLYEVDVRKPFAGCTAAGDRVTVATPVSSASCGVRLRVGETYVLSATTSPEDPERYLVNLCGYNLPVSAVPADDRAYLASRPVTCDGGLACADGDHPRLCFADPCRVHQGCEAAAICEGNPCSDVPCAAEYYDRTWNRVCLE